MAWAWKTAPSRSRDVSLGAADAKLYGCGCPYRVHDSTRVRCTGELAAPSHARLGRGGPHGERAQQHSDDLSGEPHAEPDAYCDSLTHRGSRELAS